MPRSKRRRVAPRDRNLSTDQPPTFIPVRLPPTDDAHGTFEVAFPDGLRLRVPQGFDPEDLHVLLALVRSSC